MLLLGTHSIAIEACELGHMVEGIFALGVRRSVNMVKPDGLPLFLHYTSTHKGCRKYSFNAIPRYQCTNRPVEKYKCASIWSTPIVIGHVEYTVLHLEGNTKLQALILLPTSELIGLVAEHTCRFGCRAEQTGVIGM